MVKQTCQVTTCFCAFLQKLNNCLLIQQDDNDKQPEQGSQGQTSVQFLNKRKESGQHYEDHSSQSHAYKA